MTCQLLALCFRANDPSRLAHFWGGVLGWEMAPDARDVAQAERRAVHATSASKSLSL